MRREGDRHQTQLPLKIGDVEWNAGRPAAIQPNDAREQRDDLAALVRQTGDRAFGKAVAAAAQDADGIRPAIDEPTRAIANGADDGLVWLRLAQNELAAQDDHAMASAYNSYLKSVDPVERGVALFVIGRDYDRHDKQKEALAAFVDHPRRCP